MLRDGQEVKLEALLPPILKKYESLSLGKPGFMNTRLEVDLNNKFHELMDSIKSSFMVN